MTVSVSQSFLESGKTRMRGSGSGEGKLAVAAQEHKCPEPSYAAWGKAC